MNEEIKGILNAAKNDEWYSLLRITKVRKMVEVITNLQKEKDDLKNRLENAVADCNLRIQENQKLVKVIEELEQSIKENSIYYNTSDGCQWVDQFKLLNKLTELKGGSDVEN